MKKVVKKWSRTERNVLRENVERRLTQDPQDEEVLALLRELDESEPSANSKGKLEKLGKVYFETHALKPGSSNFAFEDADGKKQIGYIMKLQNHSTSAVDIYRIEVLGMILRDGRGEIKTFEHIKQARAAFVEQYEYQRKNVD